MMNTNRLFRRHGMFFSSALVSMSIGVTACNDGGVGSAKLETEDVDVTGQAAISSTGTLIAGNDSDGMPLLICAANYNGGTHPGKMRANEGICYFTYGETVQRGSAMPGTYGFALDLIASSDSNKWTKAFKAGRESNGDPLYPCATVSGTEVFAGKTRPSMPGCQYAKGGLELTGSPYYLIAASSASALDKFPVTTIASTGTEPAIPASGAMAAVPNNVSKTKRFCLAEYQGGVHPGWTDAVANDRICHFGYGNFERTANATQYVGPSYRVLSQASDPFYAAGSEANGTKLGSCRVEYPARGVFQLGKYLAGAGECHFEYGGQKIVRTRSQFTVLTYPL